MGSGIRRWQAGALAICLAEAMLLGPMAQATAAQAGPVESPPRAAFIFGSDNRVPVADTSRPPWASVGQVVTFYNSTIRAGTGVMIGRKTVLTAAHVLYDPEFGGWAEYAEFLPGLNGREEPFGVIRSTNLVVPTAWIDRQDPRYDYGLVVLEENIGLQTGTLPLAVEDASFFVEQPLESAGYPSDLGGDRMHAVTGTGIRVEGGLLLHTLDTEPGQSGSPIWYTAGDQTRVVAILTGTRETTSANQTTTQGVGVWIDTTVAEFINDVLDDYNDEPQDIGEPTSNGDDIECGACGAGTGQALLAISAGWTVCLVSRRRRP